MVIENPGAGGIQQPAHQAADHEADACESESSDDEQLVDLNDDDQYVVGNQLEIPEVRLQPANVQQGQVINRNEPNIADLKLQQIGAQAVAQIAIIDQQNIANLQPQQVGDQAAVQIVVVDHPAIADLQLQEVGDQAGVADAGQFQLTDQRPGS